MYKKAWCTCKVVVLLILCRSLCLPRRRCRSSLLLANNSQHCWMLQVASVCTLCCMLLGIVAQSLKPVKLLNQQLPTFLLFRDHQSVTQQWFIRLHSSSNIVGVTNAYYTWSPKSYRLQPSHDVLQVPTLLGVAASLCTPLPTRTQQLPTLLALNVA